MKFQTDVAGVLYKMLLGDVSPRKSAVDRGRPDGDQQAQEELGSFWHS
jgi:hypothetical protein